MKKKKGELRPFNNLAFILFETHLTDSKSTNFEIYTSTKTVKKYLKYLQKNDLKIQPFESSKIDDYLRSLDLFKELKFSDLEQKRETINLFYKFIQKYLN